MKPRVTVCTRPDGTFEILLNEAGRHLLVEELLRLDHRWDHFHLDHQADPEIADATDVPLSAAPYRAEDRVLASGKVLLRPDEWDRQHFPHVLADVSEPIPWEGRCDGAAWAFGQQCRELSAGNPYDLNALDQLINTLMTELWDNGFSQTEIRTAFEQAIADMPRYAVGVEKRGDGPH